MCRFEECFSSVSNLALAGLFGVSMLAACGDNVGSSSGIDGTTVEFDLSGSFDTPETFFNSPFPSDLRTSADGRPDLTGYPNPRTSPTVVGLRSIADDRIGFPVMPVGYFRFDGELASSELGDVVSADSSSDLLLVNLGSGDRAGELVPLVAETLAPEDWAPEFVLAIAPRPGFVLEGNTAHAFVVKRSYGDSSGGLLGVPGALRQLAAGETPSGALGAAAVSNFAPLWPALRDLGVDPSDIAAASVFTTGDPVQALGELSGAVRDRDPVVVSALNLDLDDGDHDRYCELLGTVEYNQYQVGVPPFDEGGSFEIGADGLPITQRTEIAPVVVTIPKGPMPEAGYPLMVYFHGSGGRAATVVDAGPASEPGGPLAQGQGPAHVVAEHNIAAVGSALPLSPDRLEGAGDTAYLNFNNLSAFRDTFRQGVIEQRALIEAMTTLRISPAALAGCVGPTLPVGQTEYFFDAAKFVASGQSMGGMYTNLIAPIEPRIGAAVPTGAGGMWNKMILETDLVDSVADFVAIIIGTTGDKISFVHPGMHLLALAWETADPVAFMPRLARDPLGGKTPIPTYQPVGSNDIFFPTSIFDAAAVSYGHEQAGSEVWPEMQQELALADRGGLVGYPIADNLTSPTGEAYTGVVVQYAPDGIRDGHYIYAQLDEVKYQYGCFLATFIATGVATVPAPAAIGTPCPGLP